VNIHQTLLQIKTDFDRAIKTAKFNGKSYKNGNEAKTVLLIGAIEPFGDRRNGASL
jgi:hypothetical protein